MENLSSPDYDWLAQGLLLSLALGLLLAILLGVLMLVRPGLAFALDQRWSRWVDTSGGLAALDQPRSTERLFYRYHRLAGALVSLGAAFVLWEWAFAYRREALFAMLGERWSRPELSWVVSAGEWTIVVLHVAILLVGLIIVLRPSLLKPFEEGGNRWHEPQLSETMDRLYSPLDRLQKHPRLVGLFLLVAAGWCLAGLLPVLARLLT